VDLGQFGGNLFVVDREKSEIIIEGSLEEPAE
jgi:hypothetical protein